jgi:hypothetical protein
MIQSFTPNSPRSNPSNRRTRRQKKALSSRCPRPFRPRIESLEARTLLAVSIINGSGNGYAGLSGSNPPDTCGAAGPNSYIEVAFGIELFQNKPNGSPPAPITDSLDDFFNTKGGLPIQPNRDGQDSTVLYDNLMGRFIIGNLDADDKGNTSLFDIAVSTSSNPDLSASSWNFYQITTTQTSGGTTNWTDYPGNPGFNSDAVVLTFNLAHGTSLTGNSEIVSINAADLANGVPQASLRTFQNFVTGKKSFRPTNMHDSVAGDPMWLIQDAGDGNNINVYRMTSVLSTSAGGLTTPTQLPLPMANKFTDPPSIVPANPGGPAITNFLDSRIQKAGEFNNIIVAAHHVQVSGNQLDAQWYAIDVSGATPAFQQVGGMPNIGRIGFGANTTTVFPGIDINSSGEIGLSYMESDTNGGSANSATKGLPSVFVTARKASDGAGMTEGATLVSAGTGTGVLTHTDSMGKNDTRSGDFSGLNIDPTNGTFWGVNEFGDGDSGGTAIANFTPEDPPVVTAPNDQTSAEGAAKAFNLGSFTDADGSPWTVTVDWGDGSPKTTFSVASAGSLGTKTHTYAEESAVGTPYKVTVTVTDSTLLSDSKTFNVTVTDPEVNPFGTLISPVEGAAFTGAVVGKFTDPGGAEPNPSDSSGTINDHYKVVSIDWGDSTPLDTTSGTLSFSGSPGSTTDPFTVSGDHTYGEEGNYTITTTIDHEGVQSKITSTAMVSDPAVQAASVAVTGKESIAFALPVATFMDPGGAEPNPSDPTGGISNHYTATTDWGDGTGPSVDTITYSGAPGSKTGVFTVTGTHTFTEEGSFTATTIIDHEGILTKVINSSTIRDNYGLLVLDTTGAQALMVTGNGSVTVNNFGAVVVDSSDPKAIFLTGNAIVTATEADVGIGGGFVTNGRARLNLLEPEFNHEAATPDPIALPLPPVPTTHFAAVHDSGGPLLTLSPGAYDGGIQVTGMGSVNLLPGVYYMNGGGFSVSGHGVVTGTNVLIVNAPQGASDTISITGQAIVNLTASAGLTGANAAYNGITVFQDPASANPIIVTGQASLTMTGVLYAPNALLKIDGFGNAVVSTDSPSTGGEVIVRDTMVTGNGVLTINADPPTITLPIDTGTLTVNAGTSLAFSHIVQGTLVIGGTADSPATVTIAPSDATGSLPTAPAMASNSANAMPGGTQQPAASNSAAGSSDAAGALSAADQPASAQATPAALSGLSTGDSQTPPVNDPAPNSDAAQIGTPASGDLASVDAVFGSDFQDGADSNQAEWLGADPMTSNESLAVSLTDDLLDSLVSG